MLAIAALVLLAYANIFTNPFLFDDQASVVENQQIRGPWDWTKALTPPADTPLAGRPLVNVSLALNFAAGGLDVGGYHAVNLVLHLSCAVVLVLFLKRTIEPLAAFAAAAIWAVHPLNSEVVNYVTQRTESMMALCYLTTLYCASRALDDRSKRWPLFAVMACFAGVGAKESIVTVPVMVVLHDWLLRFGSLRIAVRERWHLYLGLAASWVPLAALVLSQGQNVTGGFTTAGVSSWTYLLDQTVMITRYLQLAIWPGPLVIYYGWPPQVTVVDVWPYLLIVLALFGLTLYTLSIARRYGFWMMWFFLTLAPTSSILPIPTEVGAERRMYLPLVGLAVLVVTLVPRLWTSRAKRPAPLAIGAVVVLLLAALATRTLARNREYATPLGMAKTVLDRWPTATAEYLVGTELASLGRHAEAIPHLQRASNGYAPAHYFLGVSLLRSGDLPGAVRELSAFVAAEPDALAARGAHGLIADALAEETQFADAVPHYREYLKARPADAEAWNALGVALANLARRGEAVDAFNGAVKSAPRDVRYRLNLASALAENGQFAEAETAARFALEIDPGSPQAAGLLKAIAAARGKGGGR